MFSEWCEENKPQIACIIETKLKQEILDSEIKIKDYDIIRSDRQTRNCGGVAIYLTSDLTYNTILKFSNSVCDVLVIKIPSNNTLICCFYRPPDCYPSEFNEAINQVKEVFKENENSDIILAGDFNFPEMDWSQPLLRKFKSSQNLNPTNQLNILLNLTDEFFLQQLITKPTRYDNVLDLVFTNITDTPYDCTTSFFQSFSDHKLIRLDLQQSESSDQPPKEESAPIPTQNNYRPLNFHKTDYEPIKSKLSKVNWTDKLNGKTVTEQLNVFNEILLQIVSQHAPLKKDRNKSFKSKFYRERRALWRQRRRILNKRNINSNHRAKLDEIETLIKKSHSDEQVYNENVAVEKIQLKGKYFFSYANKTRKGRDKIGPLIDKTSKTITEAEDMANLLQSQYCSVFSNPDPSKHIKNVDSFFDELPENDIKLCDIQFTESDIAQAIKDLKPNAAAGPDGIPPILLQKCCKEICLPLHIIFKNSLNTGEVPGFLKDAIVVPIHKGGLRSDPKNYRPISLLSLLLKVFEKVICKQIVIHLEENDLMNSNQHGFRKFRSCLSQLIEHYDFILEQICSGNSVDVVYLDYSKAFDVVDHHILLRKLRKVGISGKIGKWIHNYITKRTQKVTINGKFSREETVGSGVPQGSVLGPILFLIMISDIDNSVFKSKVSSFADDTKISHIINLRQDCEDLQSTLATIYDWSKANNLKFNEDKFQALRYGSNHETNFDYKTPSNNIIPNESYVKDLGILMSSNLRFSEQINSVASKCRSLCGWILRTFITRTANVMLKLYRSLILPRFDYCSQLWSPFRNYEWNQLEAIQRMFTSRIIETRGKNYWERLKILKLFSLERRAERYKIIYTWKIIENLAPNLETNKIIPKFNERRGRHCLIPKIYSKTSGRLNTLREHSFCIQGPQLFNCLPKSVRNLTSVTTATFKHHLNNYLLTLPDQPGIPGYAGMRPAATNSIIDQCLHSSGGILDAIP